MNSNSSAPVSSSDLRTVNALAAANEASEKNFNAEVLKAAAQNVADRERKAAVEKAERQLVSVNDAVNSLVRQLRVIRQQEQEQVKLVSLVGKAADKFRKDGDYEAFQEAYRKARNY